MVYPITKRIWLPLIRAIFIKKISGIENLPRNGNFLFVVNHQSYADAMLVGLPLIRKYNKKIHYISWSKLYTWWSTIFLERWLGTIKQDHSTEKAIELLRKGEIIGLFPEGGRTHTGKIQKIEHSGAGVLAVLGKVPVVPIAIKGAFEIWPWNRRFPRFKKNVEIIIGKPISVKKYYGKKLTRAQYLKLTRQFMNEVAKLAK